MHGSEKQVAWATEIKEKVMPAMPGIVEIARRKFKGDLATAQRCLLEYGDRLNDSEAIEVEDLRSDAITATERLQAVEVLERWVESQEEVRWWIDKGRNIGTHPHSALSAAYYLIGLMRAAAA